MDKIIGFFGQSGAGKTTVIKNFPSRVGGKFVLQDTNVIRSLFQRAPTKYTNPEALLSLYKDNINSETIQEIYEKYIRSQFQLLNDFSTEVFEMIRDRDKRGFDSVIFYDRTPVDFYVLTVCGLNYLKSHINKDLDSFNKHLLSLIKKTAEHNTDFLFDGIVITHPWNETKEKLVDGVRDQYLSNFYTGDSWYGKFDEVSRKKSKVYTIPSEVKTLDERVKLVINSDLI